MSASISRAALKITLVRNKRTVYIMLFRKVKIKIATGLPRFGNLNF